MALKYEEVARRLGRQASVQIDKRRGTEFRIAPTHLKFKGEAEDADSAPDLQVRYHGTPVVTLHPDHTYTLRTGGLATKTVLRRISEYSPLSLAVRGGAVYVQNPENGSLRPFIEGMRVDARGIMISDGETRAPQSTRSGTEEDRITDVVTRVLEDRLSAMGLSPVSGTHPTKKPAPVRAVRRPRADSPDAPSVDMADVIEHSMRNVGLSEDQIHRVTRDYRMAFNRGRDNKPFERVATPAPRRKVEVAKAPVMRCPDCKQDLRTHYDKANRYRGCEWAAKQHKP